MTDSVYKLYIKFPEDTDYASYDVLLDSLKITQIVHSGLKNVDNSVKLSIVHDQILEDKLRIITDSGVSAYITKDDERIFTGYIRRNYTFQKSYNVKSTSLEVVSPSFMLKVKVPSALRLVSPSICYDEYSLVHRLFKMAGFAESDLIYLPSFTARIPYFEVDPDEKTYYDLINTLLYEYGYILDFNADGKPICYPLVPASTTATNAFTTGISGNVHGTIQQKVAMESYEKFAVSWVSTKGVDNATLFEDTTNATSSHDCLIPVEGGKYYGEDEADSEGLYCEYNNDDLDILYAYNATLDFESSNEITLVNEEFEDYNTKAFVKIHNNGAETAYIYKLKVTGTAIAKASDNTSKLNNSDGVYANTLEYTANYLYSDTYVKNFINALAYHYKYADFTYTINSYDDFDIGSIVTISDSNFGTITTRIIQKDINCKTGLITYICEGVGEYEVSTPSVEATKESNTNYPTKDNIQTIVDGSVAQAVEDLQLVDSPTIFADTNNFVFSVNNNAETPIAQEISTTFHVIQYEQELDFYFGDIVLPNGWEIEKHNHELTFIVPKGTAIGTGYISVPVVYAPYTEFYNYIDANEEIYANEDGEIYGSYKFSTATLTYTFNLAYSGVKGGHYQGTVTSVDDLPDTTKILVGDYICWTASDTESTLCNEGKFLQCGVYAWSGLIWYRDESAENNYGAISDILSIANADLRANNSLIYEYLDHLTANSIFTDKLTANSAVINALASNEAFINKLAVNQAFVDKLSTSSIILDSNGSIATKNYSSGASSGFKLNGSTGQFECNSGIFRGSIESGPLRLNLNPVTTSYNSGSGAYIYDVVNGILSLGVSTDTDYTVSGTLNGSSYSGTISLSTSTTNNTSEDFQTFTHTLLGIEITNTVYFNRAIYYMPGNTWINIGTENYQKSVKTIKTIETKTIYTSSGTYTGTYTTTTTSWRYHRYMAANSTYQTQADFIKTKMPDGYYEDSYGSGVSVNSEGDIYIKDYGKISNTDSYYRDTDTTNEESGTMGANSLTFNVSSNTFKLLNLPRVAPSVVGAIYYGTDGILRIVPES